MMKFASLGSGSKGNATLVETGNMLLMIDCGFTVKEVRRRLARLNREIGQLTAILVTHEHSDHMSGVGSLARAVDIPVYLTDGTRRVGPDLVGVRTREINPQQEFTVGGIDIQPVAVPHDAREPCQFVLRQGNKGQLGVLTDLGSLTSHVLDCYRQCDVLLLECNHDSEMLLNGPYPRHLKQRVGGDWGHLNNAQSAELLSRLAQDQLQHLVVAHVSEKNNTRELALGAVGSVLNGHTAVTLADQQLGFDWITLD